MCFSFSTMQRAWLGFRPQCVKRLVLNRVQFKLNSMSIKEEISRQQQEPRCSRRASVGLCEIKVRPGCRTPSLTQHLINNGRGNRTHVWFTGTSPPVARCLRAAPRWERVKRYERKAKRRWKRASALIRPFLDKGRLLKCQKKKRICFIVFPHIRV